MDLIIIWYFVLRNWQIYEKKILTKNWLKLELLCDQDILVLYYFLFQVVH